MDYTKYCALTYNNKLLDQIIDGYTTINVEGRGLTSRALTTVEVPGRDGNITFNHKIEAKEIIVHYYLTADNNNQFLGRINELHELLKTDSDVEFSFGDERDFSSEKGFYRVGRLSTVTNPPYDNYKGQGTFILHCSDPYRYKSIRTLVGKELMVPGSSVYPYKIKKITTTISADRTGFQISNNTTARKIILLGDFSVGQKLVINPEAGTITLNNQNIKNRLNFIYSDWHEFVLNASDTITADESITIELEERAL